jgi:RNA polymerase sigma factor (sigma-70 family)
MSTARRFDWLCRPQAADEDEVLALSAEARFADVLAELPAVEQSALALSDIGGLDTNEIAERLGTEPAVVRKLLMRARESVQASLAEHGDREPASDLPFQNLWQAGPPRAR